VLGQERQLALEAPGFPFWRRIIVRVVRNVCGVAGLSIAVDIALFFALFPISMKLGMNFEQLAVTFV
jgi:hypothetical protein